MAVLGQGIIPTGSIANELTAVTRRAFVPKLVVQIYNSTPLLASLIANAQPATGGVSSVTVPVQGAQFVNGQWSDYSGTFNQPSVQQGAFVSEFDLKALIVPVPFLGMEGAVQLDHAVVPLIEARMNDAGNVSCDVMANALYNNTTNQQAFIGLPGAIDDGTNLVTYGTWTLLAQDFVGQESYVITPGKSFDEDSNGPRSGFRAFMVGGIPVFADPYCPEGQMYFINSNYASLYIHEQAGFAFTGFESTLSNYQLGYIGAVVTLAELVVTKPKAMTRVSGYNSITL